MNNFSRWPSVDVRSALSEVLGVEEATWDLYAGRSTKAGPHWEGKSLFLRFQELSEDPERLAAALFDVRETRAYPLWQTLPFCRGLVHKLMYDVRGTRLGRVLITKFPPSGVVYPHVDEGRYCFYYNRYHIVLAGTSSFYCGNEEVTMFPGSVWWFNNKITHSVENGPTGDRIHLIVDIRSTPND